MGNPRRLILACSTLDNLDRVAALVDRGVKKGALMARSVAELAATIDHGLLHQLSDGDDIIAISGIFMLCGTPSTIELGGTIVEEDYQRQGLQLVLLRSRLAAATLAFPDVIITSAVAPNNTTSTGNVLKAGLGPWLDAVGPVLKPCENCPKRSAARTCCYNIFHADEAARQAAVAYFVSAAPDDLPGIGPKYSVTLAIPMLRELHRPE